MKTISIFLALFFLIEAASAKVKLECFVGPIDYRLAEQNWQVSSCNDGRSLIFVSREDNPAHPFVFIVARSGEQPKIFGEGNGSQQHSAAALEALREITDAQFDSIVEATRPAEADNDA